jgi:hypothetical protein
MNTAAGNIDELTKDTKDSPTSPVRALRPLLRTMKDSEYLSHAIANAKDDQIWQAGKHQLTSTGLASWTGPMRESIQGAYSFEQSQCHTARCLTALVLANVVANVSEISRCWLRPADTGQPG